MFNVISHDSDYISMTFMSQMLAAVEGDLIHPVYVPPGVLGFSHVLGLTQTSFVKDS